MNKILEASSVANFWIQLSSKFIILTHQRNQITDLDLGV